MVNRELAIPMIHRAFEAGVNYIDTAVGYCNQDSQRAVGEALKGWRDKIVVSTKNPYYGDGREGVVDEPGEQPGAPAGRATSTSTTITASTGRPTASTSSRASASGCSKAKDQGLIRHICCSFHDNNEALMKLVDTGYVESITLQYNMLDRQLEEGIAYAHEKGIGVVVMGPVGGGRLGASSEVLAGAGARHRARAGAGAAVRAGQPQRLAWPSRA